MGFHSLIIFILGFAIIGCNSTHSETHVIEHSNGSNQTTPEGQKIPSVEEAKEIEFKKLGIIREFSGTDKAALFGVFSSAGKFQIEKVTGPSFIKNYHIGELNQNNIQKIFSKSALPMSDEERVKILNEFNGATVLYLEGYDGFLCTDQEITYEITASGKISNKNVEVKFQFEALPNLNGDCQFHKFGIVTRNED